jgi:peptidoglycan-associated lipoprotein
MDFIHLLPKRRSKSMRKVKMLLVLSAVVLCLVFAGCKKKGAMPVEAVEPPPPAQVWEPDTTTFTPQVDLEAELARRIRENLQVLYFEYNKYDLTSESLQKLRIAADFLKEESQIRIRVDGHADERGTTEYNMALGEKRANAVRDVLIRYGIDTRRIETTSFGREKPVNAYCAGDEACHSLNRRVEYTVIKK